jgi:small conductance mechanosensitive channel
VLNEAFDVLPQTVAQNDFINTTWAMGLKIAESAVIVAIGLIVSYALRKAIEKFFRLPSRAGAKTDTLKSLLHNFVKYICWFFIICQVLATFGVAVESILAVAGIGSVAIGFGAQTIVKDVITGIFILLENQYNVGDVITVNGMSGIIESLGVRTTKIRGANGDLHIIPNSAITAVTNKSKYYKRPIINLTFPAAQPVDKILNILSDEMLLVPQIPGLHGQPRVLGLIGLSVADYTVQIQGECDPEECWNIERELRHIIKLRFEKENI